MSYVYKLRGRIDSNNAKQFESEILSEYGKHGDLVLDAKELEYISSAGLRVLLKLRKMQDELEITNVSHYICDILEVTGFDNLLTVRTALREVCIENCKLIGKGGNGSVYRISDDEIIKVYTQNTLPESIENERRLGKSAFIAGVPTAIAYDTVKVGDSLGIVFEMVKGDVIASKFMNEPENFDMYAKKYAQLFKEIHTIDLSEKGLPTTKQIYTGYLSHLDEWYDEKELECLKRFIESIPEKNTMVHGDFHTNNIMVQGDELLIIDMAEISCGNPIFDLASSYYAHSLNPRRSPDSVMRYLNVTADIAIRLWDVMMRYYFDTDDSKKIEKYNSVIEGFCMLKEALIPAIWVNMPNEHKKYAVEDAKKHFFSRSEELLEKLDEMLG
ncbi:MAG: phosphotransferase [Firmicutes bacterium]|nr:phosphotransferase [Bacillota bacterium]